MLLGGTEKNHVQLDPCSLAHTSRVVKYRNINFIVSLYTPEIGRHIYTETIGPSFATFATHSECHAQMLSVASPLFKIKKGCGIFRSGVPGK